MLKTAERKLYLLEINPRFPAWIYLSHGVGRHLPAALLQLLAGAGLPSFPPLKPGVMFIRYAEELLVELDRFESLMMHGALSMAGV